MYKNGYVCKCKDHPLYLTKEKYLNDRLYLSLVYYDKEFGYELWDDLTINLPELLIENDNIVFINDSISKNILEKLEKIGLLAYLDTVKYNMGRYGKYVVNVDVMNKYIEQI